ncbi:MAG: hypothetical protein ACRDE5_13425 [Ginsengibacter sp.]
MNIQNESLQELQHIKKMMERSTKFSSISGFSAIAAGICALMGIWVVVKEIATWKEQHLDNLTANKDELATQLLLTAVVTFSAAVVTSFIFVYLRCKKLGIPVLGMSARRVIINIAIPLFVGALFIFRLATLGSYELITPACLIFYGLALINASKYTLSEIKHLGFIELGIGIINLWILGYGLILWGIGFGLMHIIYGILIWWKYERNDLPGY